MEDKKNLSELTEEKLTSLKEVHKNNKEDFLKKLRLYQTKNETVFWFLGSGFSKAITNNKVVSDIKEDILKEYFCHSSDSLKNEISSSKYFFDIFAENYFKKNWKDFISEDKDIINLKLKYAFENIFNSNSNTVIATTNYDDVLDLFILYNGGNKWNHIDFLALDLKKNSITPSNIYYLHGKLFFKDDMKKTNKNTAFSNNSIFKYLDYTKPEFQEKIESFFNSTKKEYGTKDEKPILIFYGYSLSDENILMYIRKYYEKWNIYWCLNWQESKISEKLFAQKLNEKKLLKVVLDEYNSDFENPKNIRSIIELYVANQNTPENEFKNLSFKDKMETKKNSIKSRDFKQWIAILEKFAKGAEHKGEAIKELKSRPEQFAQLKPMPLKRYLKDISLIEEYLELVEEIHPGILNTNKWSFAYLLNIYNLAELTIEEKRNLFSKFGKKHKLDKKNIHAIINSIEKGLITKLDDFDITFIFDECSRSLKDKYSKYFFKIINFIKNDQVNITPRFKENAIKSFLNSKTVQFSFTTSIKSIKYFFKIRELFKLLEVEDQQIKKAHNIIEKHLKEIIKPEYLEKWILFHKVQIEYIFAKNKYLTWNKLDDQQKQEILKFRTPRPMLLIDFFNIKDENIKNEIRSLLDDEEMLQMLDQQNWTQNTGEEKQLSYFTKLSQNAVWEDLNERKVLIAKDLVEYIKGSKKVEYSTYVDDMLINNKITIDLKEDSENIKNALKKFKVKYPNRILDFSSNIFNSLKSQLLDEDNLEIFWEKFMLSEEFKPLFIKPIIWCYSRDSTNREKKYWWNKWKTACKNTSFIELNVINEIAEVYLVDYYAWFLDIRLLEFVNKEKNLTWQSFIDIIESFKLLDPIKKSHNSENSIDIEENIVYKSWKTQIINKKIDGTTPISLLIALCINKFIKWDDIKFDYSKIDMKEIKWFFHWHSYFSILPRKPHLYLIQKIIESSEENGEKLLKKAIEIINFENDSEVNAYGYIIWSYFLGSPLENDKDKISNILNFKTDNIEELLSLTEYLISIRFEDDPNILRKPLIEFILSEKSIIPLNYLNVVLHSYWIYYSNEDFRKLFEKIKNNKYLNSIKFKKHIYDQCSEPLYNEDKIPGYNKWIKERCRECLDLGQSDNKK